MKFKINNMNWEIEEISQEEIKTMQNERKAKDEENVKSLDWRYYGITYNDDLKIYIDKNLHADRKKKTLIHELTHCYINSYITHQDKNYNEEDIADIVSNSYDIVHEIVDKYFILVHVKIVSGVLAAGFFVFLVISFGTFYVLNC